MRLNVGGGLYLEYLDDPRYEVDWVDVWQETASAEIYICKLTPGLNNEPCPVWWTPLNPDYQAFVSLNDLVTAMDKASQLLRGTE
jgi:hypothetical protein